MSKWIDKNLFETFVDEKEKEEENKPKSPGGFRDFDIFWPAPERGTEQKPKVYEGRFLPDPNGNFYRKLFYHMFRQGERWQFLICQKTFNFDNFCPWCYASMTLWSSGSKQDKDLASNYKRKEKFVGNWYIVDDPRDAEREADAKFAGKVKLWEFPSKIESKVKEELLDKRRGLGSSIFDPGEDGINFIVKVKSTKPSKDNKIWPDYSDSTFARENGPLADSERNIKKIMDTRHDISNYFKELSESRSQDDIIDLLKEEALWDLVEDAWVKNVGPLDVEKRPAVKSTKDDRRPFEEVDDEDAEPAAGKEEELDDEQLLRELEDLET